MPGGLADGAADGGHAEDGLRRRRFVPNSTQHRTGPQLPSSVLGVTQLPSLVLSATGRRRPLILFWLEYTLTPRLSE